MVRSSYNSWSLSNGIDMVWRGSTTPLDRIFAALVYTFPLVVAYLRYSGPLLRDLDFLAPLFIPLQPFVLIYGLIVAIVPFGLGGLVIFFLLFFLVVRNERIRHFIRFNTMQAILIGIVLSIFSILWMLVGTIFPFLIQEFPIIQDTIYNVLFLGALTASLYSIVQSVLGKYAEIPTISDAAYMRVR